MKTQVEQRLQQLKDEYENGQQMLADLDNQRSSLRDTLLRINGAIQVLEEVVCIAYQAKRRPISRQRLPTSPAGIRVALPVAPSPSPCRPK